MMLKTKKIPKEMKEYSIVGDLISYLRCPQAYRKTNMGNLIPSRPSQLWFGNFVHGVMQEIYYLYHEGVKIPPPLKPTCEIRGNLENFDKEPKKANEIDYRELVDEIKQCDKNCTEKRCLYRISYDISSRLAAQRIYARSVDMFNAAIFRIYLLLNEIGKELIPLINAAEVPLKGIRRYKGKPLNVGKFSIYKNLPKETFYEIHGIVDVISQFNVQDYSTLISEDNKIELSRNIILDEIGKKFYPELFNDDFNEPNNEQTKKIIEKLNSDYSKGFEIILDYKGQIRPELTTESDWDKHEWQIRTYKWLREQQMNDKPVIAGILLYINEIYPSKEDVKNIIKFSSKKFTDKPLVPDEITKLTNKSQDYLSKEFKSHRRSRIIRLIDLRNSTENKKSLEKFDRTVLEIENCSYVEKITGNIEIWKKIGEKQMCGTCDSRWLCDKNDKNPTIPEAP